jgi:hypothetical protein
VKLGVVVRRDAEQFGNHRDRQRIGQVGDQIGLPHLHHTIQQPVGDGLDAAAHLLDHPRGKGFMH